ncbi:disease resistance protein RUN1-like [Gastrolobium bilobum]|uniref:disease resistance protein RUN1-like n=1 Tax=Gastrolobium bilobum TaxID=150636 RepID=UPI002AB1A6F4|nr:disease resistance protein RUN1-like [Gastrolobium bilobum]
MALSSESYKWKYDVFLSFRGYDTRRSFTSHLYHALCQKGVNTFIDYKELKRGEKISPSLFRAIEDSRISVVILSKKYASSTSCLDELLKILECKDSKGQLVLPVFYAVNPSQVREQQGSFEEDLAKQEEKFWDDMDKVKRWRAALCEVSTLSGWHLGDGQESKFVQRIVEEILSKLNRTPFSVAKHPVGLDSPIEDIKSLLKTGLDDVRAIGIYGTGGIDDVDSLEQLESLVGENSWFGSGTRIIITTRDKHLLIAHKVETAYKVKELSHGHALELFSWFAFKRPCPSTDYEELSFHMLNYAKGLPLALTVLGSYLCGRDKVEWKSALAKLKKIPDRQIYEMLKISFDGLEENEKAIFLDIACFFKGEDKHYVKMILDGCDMHTDIGIRVLMDKSLIAVELNKLWMHDLLHEMAKEIVRCESPKEPGKRSRLWFHEDVLHVFNQNTGTDNIEGIRLDLPEPHKVNINGKALANMKRLRLLMINNADVSDDIQYLSNELRLIDWPGYPSSTLPPDFHPKRLVSLNMSHGRIKHLWKGAKIFRDLKLVSFSCCEYLTEIPDFSMVPNLESLNLDHCKSLVKVHESVGYLDKLVTLNFLLCSNLKTFPSRFKLKSLRTLLLTGCSNLRKFPEVVEKMEHLEEILLQGTAIKELPQSIEYLIGLKVLLLDSCKKLEHFPSSLQNLQYLTGLVLTDCSKLQELPKLPLNIRFIDTSNCRSLSSPSNFSVEDFPRFSHMCVLILSEKYIQELKLIFMLQESIDEVMLPGSKIPDWFHHQSTNGSISIEVASRLYGKHVELFFGAVFELEKGATTTGMFSCVYEVIINDRKTLAIARNFESLDSSHVWLTRIKFGRLMLRLNSMHYWNHFRISFGISEVSSNVKVKASLKSCGFHILCKQEGCVTDHETVRK